MSYKWKETPATSPGVAETLVNRPLDFDMWLRTEDLPLFVSDYVRRLESDQAYLRKCNQDIFDKLTQSQAQLEFLKNQKGDK